MKCVASVSFLIQILKYISTVLRITLLSPRFCPYARILIEGKPHTTYLR